VDVGDSVVVAEGVAVSVGVAVGMTVSVMVRVAVGVALRVFGTALLYKWLSSSERSSAYNSGHFTISRKPISHTHLTL
jgi:hypothetical protein